MNMLRDLLARLPLLMGAPEGAGEGAAGGGAGLVTMLLPFALIILVFYFLIIRPQSKKQKETKAMLSSLQKNDRVATIGGIRGVIVSVKEETVIIRVDSGVKMEFSKSAVSSVIERKEGSKGSSSTAEGPGQSKSGKDKSAKASPAESEEPAEDENQSEGADEGAE
jgi:preprotein translocase subunit YajC